MPSPAPGSRLRTPPSCPLPPMDGSRPYRPIFAPRWKRRCSLLALAAAGACTSTPVQSTISPVDVAGRARPFRVEDTRRDEPAFVDSLLEAGDPSARAAAALTAGRVGARAHLAALHRLVSDPDTGVAGTALFALGLLKDTTALDLGVGALHAPDAVAAEGAWLLGQLGERGR